MQVIKDPSIYTKLSEVVKELEVFTKKVEDKYQNPLYSKQVEVDFDGLKNYKTTPAQDMGQFGTSKKTVKNEFLDKNYKYEDI